MGPVVEWARRWLGITQLEARVRLAEAETRRLALEVERLRSNLDAAEREAVKAVYRGDANALASVLSVLRRGR